MLEFKKGVDILSAVGGIGTIDAARSLFKRKLDSGDLERLSNITNEEALLKVANAIAMCQPDKVMVLTGSEADKEFVRKYSIEKCEEKPLAIPGHTYHFDLPEDQGRLLSQTMYIVNEDEKISSLAQRELRSESHAYIKKHMTGIMKGKMMFVGFYSRGPVGARASIPAIEISSSTYVLHSAELLYRNCYADFDAEIARRGEFFTNVHSEGPNRAEDIPNCRIYMDRSWQTTYSMFCTYAGNTLLMKKGNHRFASDTAIYRHSGLELSEHMFITGMTGPGGRKTYFAGAAPSGCGKTTTAMVGSDFIGDDLAQLWIAGDGTLRAVNPEIGIFGIVEDVNIEGDPYLMKCLRERGTEVIFSNVLIDENKKPRWVGDGEPVPGRGINYQGEWTPDMVDVPMSHPNSRCTLLSEAIANHNKEVNADPSGVLIEVVTYSGRDSDTMPPIWVAKTMDEGVVIGASIVSKATATEIGATGVRRQPWANAPFIAGGLGDYLDAQFKFFNNPRLRKRPVIAGLNYFLTHEDREGGGKGLLGAKKDVHVWLGWLDLYAHGDVEALETPIGMIPKYADLERLFSQKINKKYSEQLYTMQFSLYVDNIISRIDMQIQAWKKEEGVGQTIFDIYAKQKAALEVLKAAKGAIVKPQDL
ncbi:MAG TPA: phosphoenolpyruvate carboxykinase (GTP) [Candidatus Hydrogenedentes bacterium]|nr:phosphoenolpyruvate carboxykinase (GTP) [Candidatus Hydrogenedentota bacterium]HQE82593.1 phosphoenolpyruvate carboxykinase (GTP) [Candidatus Hydrogenedentota bacterium]HQH53518.1 phosphoenolpyruvate carboxykinase (GTP) [Candidatus Hydrogenedentota bacterium]HQM48990.1 phosphoenolpyruvate carboxykinase (GTP) [Candidatus Hydrogenedentota bacterium]